MDSLRQELGLAAKEQRFPRKETCLQIYSYRVNTQKLAEGDARAAVSLVRAVGSRSDAPVSRVRRAEAALHRARLRRSAAVLARHDVRAAPGAARRRALRSRARGRIPGHQQAAGGDPVRPAAGRRGTRGGRRRRPGHLFVPRRGGREHPRISRPLQAACRSRHAGAELSLDPGSAGRRQLVDGRCAAPVPQAPAVDPGQGRPRRAS